MPRQLNQYLHFGRYLARRFLEDNCIKNAAALTYTTLFAVVPVMTVAYAMLAAIPAFDQVGSQVEAFIFKNFLPASGAALQQHLSAFSSQARQLTGVGVALLMVTALLMLVNIEKAFNDIWRIRQPRRGLSSFLLYWAVLSIGPLLLGAGFVVSTYVASMSFFQEGAFLASAWSNLLRFLPLILSIAAFTLLFVAVPNTRVPLKYGVAGGVLVALLFEGAKACFALYVKLFPGYQLIYGAFAAVPLFLLWIYVSWLIILLGAELVSNMGNGSAWRRPEYPWMINLLVLLRLFLRAQQQGVQVDLARVNASGWLMHEELWLQLTDWLESEALITRTQSGAFVLCRDLEQVELSHVLERMPEPPLTHEALPAALAGDHGWFAPFSEALGHADKARREALRGSVKHWLLSDSLVASPLPSSEVE
ncbi:YihY family inner membrane protein [Halopseudomonas maritima]|uniref:YihY family inner membrane protein n=1 Tax=Halopseudomonas maritima TaxID=2918528 RepID=UPI001EEC3D5F|nr:YihY family inner membrane protein [Halopseudomonas maritima]UJJ32304.1 YihY family inner membrane protein [Halopseudomonas maritima]